MFGLGSPAKTSTQLVDWPWWDRWICDATRETIVVVLVGTAEGLATACGWHGQTSVCAVFVAAGKGDEWA